jgi:hypothetical protein
MINTLRWRCPQEGTLFPVERPTRVEWPMKGKSSEDEKKRTRSIARHEKNLSLLLEEKKGGVCVERE